jgi:hypothetical protein
MKRGEMRNISSFQLFSFNVLDVDKTLQPKLLTALFILRSERGGKLNRERNSCCNCKNKTKKAGDKFLPLRQRRQAASSEHDFAFFKLNIPSGEHVRSQKMDEFFSSHSQRGSQCQMLRAHARDPSSAVSA